MRPRDRLGLKYFGSNPCMLGGLGPVVALLGWKLAARKTLGIPGAGSRGTRCASGRSRVRLLGAVPTSVTAARSPASPTPGGPRRAAQPELSALCTPSTPARASRRGAQRATMAQDGLYTKLHLAVRARTQPGQVVLVSGSATSDRTSGALEMVTSPDQYPIWRTPKPVIIARADRKSVV